MEGGAGKGVINESPGIEARVVADQFFARAPLEEGLVRDRVTDVGLKEVLPQTSGRFVGHLDTILEHRHWKLCRRGGGRRKNGGEEERRGQKKRRREKKSRSLSVYNLTNTHISSSPHTHIPSSPHTHISSHTHLVGGVGSQPESKVWVNSVSIELLTNPLQ